MKGDLRAFRYVIYALTNSLFKFDFLKSNLLINLEFIKYSPGLYFFFLKCTAGIMHFYLIAKSANQINVKIQ